MLNYIIFLVFQPHIWSFVLLSSGINFNLIVHKRQKDCILKPVLKYQALGCVSTFKIVEIPHFNDAKKL